MADSEYSNYSLLSQRGVSAFINIVLAHTVTVICCSHLRQFLPYFTFLIEEIRKKLVEMRTTNRTIEFCWVKAHVGIQGKELADTLAKEAATNADLIESYKKVPNSVVMSELSEISVETWQREWDLTTKSAITKEYFPVIADRLSMNINITTNLTIIITGHGNIRSYIHRFKIMDTPTCACGSSDQTMEHMLYECVLTLR